MPVTSTEPEERRVGGTRNGRSVRRVVVVAVVVVTVLAGIASGVVGAAETRGVVFDFEDDTVGDPVAQYGERIAFDEGRAVIAATDTAPDGGQRVLAGVAPNVPIVLTFDEPQDRVRFDARGSKEPPGPTVLYDVTATAFDADGNEVDRITRRVSVNVWTEISLAAPGSARIERVSIATIGGGLIGGGCCVPNPVTAQIDRLGFDAHGPRAEIGVTSNTVSVNDGIRFVASTRTEGRIDRIVWEFEDGTSASDRSFTRRFTRPGQHLVSLTVTDEFGLEAQDTIRVTVLGAVDPTFSYRPELPDVGQAVQFDASDTEVDGTVASYEWEFGDGSDATGSSPVHTYDEVGIYTVTLTVTDTNGQTGSVDRPITVNGPPVANFTTSVASGNVTLGERITFDASDSSDESFERARISWDYGDGTQGSNVRSTHVYEEPGTYTVTLTLTDDRGVSAAVTDEITVLAPPTADLDVPGDGEVDANEEVTFDASGSADSDGRIAEYRWNFGDGSEPAVTTAPSTAHVYTDEGTYTVTVTVVDDDRLRDSAQVTVNVAPASSLGGIAGDALLGLLGLLALVVVGFLAYRWYQGRERSTGPGPDPDPGQWQDIVIEAVEERRESKRLVLRNTSDRTYDLSGARILDDDGQAFTFRDGLRIEPGERESLPVDSSMSLTPGNLVLLETREERYELPWQEFLDGRGTGG